jgi:hypothetical protein
VYVIPVKFLFVVPTVRVSNVCEELAPVSFQFFLSITELGEDLYTDDEIGQCHAAPEFIFNQFQSYRCQKYTL